MVTPYIGNTLVYTSVQIVHSMNCRQVLCLIQLPSQLRELAIATIGSIAILRSLFIVRQIDPRVPIGHEFERTWGIPVAITRLRKSQDVALPR